MKKVGELYTVRGQVPVDTMNYRIQLFDGRFDTAYRIVDFTIAGGTPMENHEAQGVLATAEMTIASSFNWADNIEIAWALWNGPNVYSGPLQTWVDRDNLVVEDLFFTNRGTADTLVNYMITMQKYDISDWQGALSMVRNKSQG